MNVDTSFENSVIEQNTPESDKISEMLRAGIEAAQAGNRKEARLLLLSVTEADAANENAWLWLASISEYPEELLIFLKNVLSINPENERALEWTKATKSLLAKTFVERGIDVHKQGQADFAKQYFLQAIFNDDENDLAWLWLASVTDAVEEKMSHLHKVLRLNPENETAHASLQAAKSQKAQNLMRKANAAAVSGQPEVANQILDRILQHSPDSEDAWILKSYLTGSFDEKLEYFEKVLEINPSNETAQASVGSLRLMKSAVEAKEAEDNLPEKEHQPEAESVEVSENDETEQFEAKIPQPETDFAEAAEEPAQGRYLSESEETQTFEEPADEVPSEEKYVSEVETAAQPEHYEQAEISSEKDHLEIAPENPISEYAENFPEEILETGESEKEDFYSQVQEVVEEIQFDEQEIVEPFQETAAAESEYARSDAPVQESVDEYQPEETVEEASVGEPEVFDEFEEENFPEEIVEENFETENAVIEEIVTDESGAENFEATYNGNGNGNGAAHHFESEQTACPFCRTENDVQAFVCNGCNAVLTLSDVEMLLSHKNADAEMLRRAVEQMEGEEAGGGFDADELTTLGIGYINLDNLRGGLNYLQKAARLDPNNILLNSQIHSLEIRLAEIEEQESIHRSMPQNRTIMVVDDSATVRKLISSKLEKSGHTVIIAVDGVDALEKLKDVVPDLVLLDITMPRMDGYQVCKMIRNDSFMKDVPVVMISGKDGFFDKVRGRMAGTTGYITKPFGPETLMKTVEAFVAQNAETVVEDEVVVSG